MSDPNLRQVEAAWREAGDTDLAAALGTPEDVPPEVYSVIQAEARRRNVDHTDAARREHSSNVAMLLIRTGVRFVASHPIVSAAAFGAVLSVCAVQAREVSQNWHPSTWLALYFGIFLTGVGAISWPLRVYRLGALNVVAAVGGTVSVALFDLRIAYPATTRLGALVMLLLGALAAWIVMTAFLCGIVFLRRRYWPFVPPGHCAKCGYDLRGLPEPRCPECGRPFEKETQGGGHLAVKKT